MEQVGLDPHTGQGEPDLTCRCAVFLAEVSVTAATAETYADHTLICTDVDVIDGRLNVDGQMRGSLSQGVGLALTEDFDDLKKHTSMKACGIQYPKDVTGNLAVMCKETPRPTGPYGACGCDEAPLTAPHVAIINAIDNICGACVRRLPVSPSRIAWRQSPRRGRRPVSSSTPTAASGSAPRTTGRPSRA
jgi:aldehyde oxidoreductase